MRYQSIGCVDEPNSFHEEIMSQNEKCSKHCNQVNAAI